MANQIFFWWVPVCLTMWKRKQFFSGSCSIKEANDMQTLLDRNIYIFHSRVQTAVTASQGNFETRWSLSHTKHHEKNRGEEGVGGMARGIWDKHLCTWQFSILGFIRRGCRGLLPLANTPPCSHSSSRSYRTVLGLSNKNESISNYWFPGRVVRD